MNARIRMLKAAAVLSIASVSIAAAGDTSFDTAFTYQGHAKRGGFPLDGTADFRFTLWADEQNEASEVAGPVFGDNVPITDGLFTVEGLFERSYRLSVSYDGYGRWERSGVA